MSIRERVCAILMSPPCQKIDFQFENVQAVSVAREKDRIFPIRAPRQRPALRWGEPRIRAALESAR